MVQHSDVPQEMQYDGKSGLEVKRVDYTLFGACSKETSVLICSVFDS